MASTSTKKWKDIFGLKQILFLFVVVLGVGFLLVQFAENPVRVTVDAPVAVEPMPLINDESIVQELVSEDMILTDVSIMFGTYAKTNHGKLFVELYENGVLVQAWEQDTSKLIDNTAHMFELDDPLSMSIDNSYSISISQSYEGDNAVAVWMSADNARVDCNYGDQLLEWDVGYGLFSYNRELTIFKNLIISLLLLFAIGVAYILLFTQLGIEKRFMLLVFVLGVFYMVTITPLSVPDEDFHYRATYKLSNYLLLNWENATEWDASAYDYSGFTPHYNTSDGYIRIIEDFDSPYESRGKMEIPPKHEINYVIHYLPQSVGIALGRIFKQNFIITYYLGRICNLLFYAVCAYLAVKRTPKYKLLIGLVSLVPMALHQAASFSYDSFINGVSIVLIASLLKAIYEDDPLSRKDYLYILILGALLSPTKMVYFSILLMAVLIPENRFGSMRRKVWGVILILLAGIAMIGIVRFSSILTTATSGGNDLNWEGQHSYTIGYILKHPVQTIIIFWNSFITNVESWSRCSIGFFLSGLSLPISEWISFCFAVILFFSACNQMEEDYRNSFQTIRMAERCILLLISLCVIALTMLSMFLAWTSNTRDIIQGVQGRYFTPILSLVFMAIANRRFAIRRLNEKQLAFMAVILNVTVIFEIVAYTVAH